MKMKVLSRCAVVVVVLLSFSSKEASVVAGPLPSSELAVEESTAVSVTVDGVIDSAIEGSRQGRDRVLLRRHTDEKNDALLSAQRVLTTRAHQHPHPTELHHAKQDGLSGLFQDPHPLQDPHTTVISNTGEDNESFDKNSLSTLGVPPKRTDDGTSESARVTPRSLPVTHVLWTISMAADHGASIQPQNRGLRLTKPDKLSASTQLATAEVGIDGNLNTPNQATDTIKSLPSQNHDHDHDHDHRVLQSTSYPYPQMNNYGGGIMTTTKTVAIFWGKSWSSGTSTGNWKNKIAGIDAYYNGYSAGSTSTSPHSYSNIPNEYATTPTTHTYLGHYVDASTRSSANTNGILNEICKVISAIGLANQDLGGNNSPYYFPVYIDTPRPSGTNYCAYHSAAYCNTVGGVYQVFQYAFFFQVDNDPGCSITGYTGSSGTTAYTNTKALNSLVNLSSHEVTEMRTDPAFIVNNNPNNWGFYGWYDSQGSEIGDKCAWSFPAGPVTFPAVTGPTTYLSAPVSYPITTWQVQGEWSNNAYQCSTNPSTCPPIPNPTTYNQGCVGTA